MTKLANFFIQNYKFTFVLSCFMIIFGVGGLMRVNAESYPAVDFAMATVITNYDGASAEDVETRITKPLEDEIRTVTGLKDVRSTSQPGLSTISIRADIDNVDVEAVMSDIQRSVDRVTGLPGDLKDPPKFTEIKSEEFPVVEIAVVGSNENRRRDIVTDLLKEEIEDNKSVLNARPEGYEDRAFQIELDPAKMQQLHIGIDEVINKITTRNRNIPGGTLKATGTQKLVRIEGKINDREELENIVIRSNFSGKSIRLKDIATVLDSEDEAKKITHYNGEDATLLVVRKKSGADTIEMVDDILKKIQQFEETYAGEFKFVVFNNESVRVANKLGVLSSNAITGLILVVFFLLIFLPGRIGLMASLSLPLAVLVTMGFVPVLDMNLNAITILALVIALGMLVDNSVVISENYARLRDEGYNAMGAAELSIKQLWLPISATVMTTIAAFLPMLVTKGIMGQFIKYIPVIVTVSLLVSLVESFFFLPMRLIQLDPDKKIGHEKKQGWFDKLAGKFESFMRVVVEWRYVAAFGYMVLLVGSLVMMIVFNKMVLFPADQTEIFVGRVELPRGSTLEDTESELKALSSRIMQDGGKYFDHVVSRAGTTQEGPIDPKGKEGDNVGLLIFYVNEDTRDFTPDAEVLDYMRSVKLGEKIEKATFEARVNGPPVGDPVNVTFRSNNGDSLDKMVEGVMAKLNDSDGIRDVRVDDVFGDNQVYVKIDYAKADRLGLNVDTVGNAVRSAISGRVVSDVNLNNKEVDIVVRFEGEGRQQVGDLQNIEVMDRLGNLIPLNKFATISSEGPKPYIKRFDFKRAKTVTAQIDESVTNALAANKLAEDAYRELNKEANDVALVFGGEGENTKESMESLWSALMLSLIGIFALLVFLFNSFLRPLIIMTTIPLGLVGFSIAFWAHGRPISFLALIGVIGLGGIIVNSGIILITFIDQLLGEGEEFEEALAKASRLRLRAVMVSSLTTISGLLPTAYGIGGSDTLLIPMTLAMAWGLTSGTILTLVWVPAAYAIIEDIQITTKKAIGGVFGKGNDWDGRPQDKEVQISKVVGE